MTAISAKPVGDRAKLVQALAAYRDAIDSGLYHYSVKAHCQVWDAAMGALVDPVVPYNVKRALNKVCNEMLILCLAPVGKPTWSVSCATAYRRANFLLWGKQQLPVRRNAKGNGLAATALNQPAKTLPSLFGASSPMIPTRNEFAQVANKFAALGHDLLRTEGELPRYYIVRHTQVIMFYSWMAVKVLLGHIRETEA